MESIEKRTLTYIGNIKLISNVIEKLELKEEMNEAEKSFLLECAILLIKEYEKDRRYKSYFEFGYYIILNYCVQNNDYIALNDIAIDYGFYPISKFIYEQDLLNNVRLSDIIVDVRLNEFKYDGYIETSAQHSTRENIVNSINNEVAFVAPTSYGKSSVIIEYIKNHPDKRRIAIIVPTKSLLNQTTRSIKEADLSLKLLTHDEMYNEEEEYIAILTQERALRMMEKENVYFDLMFIDEAHNLFCKDSRNVLLARVIRRSKRLFCNIKIIYLSPLIDNVENLCVDENQKIVEQRIDFNIKEAELYEYRKNGEIYKYNRFINKFYAYDKEESYMSFIIHKIVDKSFFYIISPRKIEEFSKELFEQLEEESIGEDIQVIKDMLSKYVHEDFCIKKLVEKGIIYLHGKMPDSIKEYLEHKYSQCNDLKYLVANTVILEGMNLPIKQLFILNTYSLHENELINLIGRVNRLNLVFDKKNGDLSKLLPKVYFVNSDKYNAKNGCMTNKIKLLRSNRTADIIRNPMLKSFDINEVKDEYEKQKYREIISNENRLFIKPQNIVDKVYRVLIKNSMQNLFSINDEFVDNLILKIQGAKNDLLWFGYDIMDRIFYLFIENNNSIIDFELSRLQHEKTREYYRKFNHAIKNNSLKQIIKSELRHFEEKKKTDKPYLYIGKEFGEFAIESSNDYKKLRKVYVSLDKPISDLVNIAVVKVKLEQDFISYKYNKLIECLLDFGLITQKEYNQEIYGTNDDEKLFLMKLGLSGQIVGILEADNQLQNLYSDEKNNLCCTNEFKKYLYGKDDFFNFQIRKYLNI